MILFNMSLFIAIFYYYVFYINIVSNKQSAILYQTIKQRSQSKSFRIVCNLQTVDVNFVLYYPWSLDILRHAIINDA